MNKFRYALAAVVLVGSVLAVPSMAHGAEPHADHRLPEAQSVAPADRVTVEITAARDESWVYAKNANGRVLFQGVLHKGRSVTLTDHDRIDLTVGNAGAVDIRVDGRKIEDSFEDGQAERLSYSRADRDQPVRQHK
jgi:hypothetical protein